VSVVTLTIPLLAAALYMEQTLLTELNVTMLQFEFAEHELTQSTELGLAVELIWDWLVLLTVNAFFCL
jgi:DNA-binding PucR family transcriptional regulator